jgi:hypothetical protein
LGLGSCAFDAATIGGCLQNAKTAHPRPSKSRPLEHVQDHESPGVAVTAKSKAGAR